MGVSKYKISIPVNALGVMGDWYHVSTCASEYKEKLNICKYGENFDIGFASVQQTFTHGFIKRRINEAPCMKSNVSLYDPSLFSVCEEIIKMKRPYNSKEQKQKKNTIRLIYQKKKCSCRGE